MNVTKFSVGCLVLVLSHAAWALGPFSYKPIYKPISTPIRTPVLASGIKVSPLFVSTYEPSTNLYVLTPRLRVAAENKTPEVTRLSELLKIRGQVEVPTALADPVWMQQYRHRSVLPEDPKLLLQLK